MLTLLFGNNEKRWLKLIIKNQSQINIIYRFIIKFKMKSNTPFGNPGLPNRPHMNNKGSITAHNEQDMTVGLP